MVASVLSLHQLLYPRNVWARLVGETQSDAEFTEGVHYEVTDFRPTRVFFSRRGDTPAVGLAAETAYELRSDEIYDVERELAGPAGLGAMDETQQSFTTPSTPSTPSTPG